MLSHITMFQPSAVDNALSTMQIIHKLINEMNTVIDEVNTIDSKANEYTDSKVLELKNQLEEQINLLNNRVTNLSSDVSNYTELVYEISNLIVQLQTRLTSEIARLDDKIDSNKIELLQSINNVLNLAKNYTDTEISKLKLYIEKLIEERTIYAYSQFDGYKKPINNVLFDIQKRIACMASRDISINLFDRLMSVYIYAGGESAIQPKNCTISELNSIWENLTQDYVVLQKSANATSSVMGKVIFKADDFRYNPFMHTYYLIYKLMKLRDISTYVSWYNIYQMLYSSIGFDSAQFTYTFNYTSTY